MKMILGTSAINLSQLLKRSLSACALVLFLAVPVASIAQETSSAVRGVVSDESGTPLSNATVILRNPDTGLTRSVQTNSSGEFNIRNLPVGYKYTVEVSNNGYGSERIENLSLNLGKTAEANFDLVASETIEEIIVSESRLSTIQVAVGPNAAFSLDVLQSVPAINRDINDVLRADARIYVDESRGDINAVQCGGKNPRFNSLTVDGVRMNDSFGLNSNGYPTERMPFSFDAINQVVVELAPFDVEYGGFSACNINAVTKSGTNNFTGSVFYDFSNDSLRGDKLEGDSIASNSFDRSRYGVTFGGPIIQDKLFFFAAYEKLDGVNLFDRGAIGSGAVNEIMVTQAELDEIADIARTIYQYEPGDIPSVLDNEDEKLLIKLDWNISDEQRLIFVYNYNDGFNNTQSDGDQNEFEFSKHLYFRGTELQSYSSTLYSDWTPNFSTEMRVSYVDVENTHESLGGTDFGEIRIELADVDVYLGGDDSRQANKLIFDVLTFSFKGNLDLDNGHNLTFGVEREDLDVFNLFVQHTDTEIRFNSIDLFRQGLADDLYYNNAPSNNQDDAAAVWGYALNTVFGQDEFDIGDRLTIVAGLRYDWYTTSDAPLENSVFVADYGFSNSTNLDNEGLLQPRLGFTFDLSDATTIRGGIGLYTGGNPNVWLSNNFSANNVLQFGQRGRSFCYTDDFRGNCGPVGMEVQISLLDPSIVWSGCESGVPVGAGYCTPSELFDAVASGVGDNFEINYLDPNFKLPSEWKFALGVTHVLPRDYVLSADILLTRTQDAAIVLHGDIDQVGTDPDGYPDYSSTREPTFVLTNSNEDSTSLGLSVGLAKAFDNGFEFRVGYAYSDAEDVQPMTSSVAFSNYQNRAFFDPQEQVSSVSNYNIEHRFTFTTTWRKTFFSNLDTTISLYGSANSGRPYSISYDGTASPYGFTPFLDFRDNVLLPGVERNGQNGSWWRKMDLRINVGFPGFRREDTASAFIVVDNLTNLLNDDWGVLKQYNFPRTVVDGTTEPRIGNASLYEIWFGLQYSF